MMTINSVLTDHPDGHGQVAQWVVGAGIPGNEKTSLITNIFDLGDAVEIFALPLEGTKLHREQQGMRFRIAMSSVKLMASSMPIESWQEARAETEEQARTYDEGEDVDDGEEEEEEPSHAAGEDESKGLPTTPAPPLVPQIPMVSPTVSFMTNSGSSDA